MTLASLSGITAYAVNTEKTPSLELSIPTHEGIEIIRTNLFNDHYIDSIEAPIKINVSPEAIKVNEQALSSDQREKYEGILSQTGIKTSETTLIDINIIGHSLSIDVGNHP